MYGYAEAGVRVEDYCAAVIEPENVVGKMCGDPWCYPVVYVCVVSGVD